jgi:hypothetical protein
MRALFLVITSLLLAGCGKKSACKSFEIAICDECDVGDRERDTTCACLKDGKVSRAQDYFEDANAAEAWCDKLKTENEKDHLSEDDLDICEGKLDLMDEYGDDACSYFEYEPREDSSGGESSSDEGDVSETGYYCELAEDCTGMSFEGISEAECAEILEQYC